MKKSNVFSLLIITYFTFGMSVNSYSQCHGSGVVNDLYIPYDWSLEERSVTINVNFIEDVNSEWNTTNGLLAQEALLYAAGIWGQILTSDVDIEIDAFYTPAPDPEPGILLLGAGTPLTYVDGLGSPALPDTKYPIALANKIEGVDIAPDISDIQLIMNSDVPWYYSPESGISSMQYDFITTALHELAHGLGFEASVSAFENEGFGYGIDGLPHIYDTFIKNSDNALLTDFDIDDNNNIDLYSYLTSDNLYWSGESDNSVKLYSPSLFEKTSTASHLDPTLHSNSLMTPNINFMEVIHEPGNIVRKMLEDIGWEVDFTNGIGDYVEIHGYDYDCANSSNSSVCWPFLINPKTEFNIGEDTYYKHYFVDVEPYNSFGWVEWKVEVLYNGGKYLLEQSDDSYASTEWHFTMPDLPQGYHWLRNGDNQVLAEITVSGHDLQNWHHEETLPIVINYRPNLIEMELVDIGTDTECSSATVEFHAAGATGYTLYYASFGLFPEAFWYVADVPEGDNSITVSLGETSHYSFMVEAFNDYGEITSDSQTREACGFSVVTSPNPTVDFVTVRLVAGDDDDDGGDEIEPVIDKVDIKKLDNPNIQTSKLGDGYSKELEVDVNSLPPGTYNVEVRNTNGKVESQIIIIF